MFKMAEDPVEIGYAIKAAEEAYIRYTPAGARHEFFSLSNPLFLNKPDKSHS